LQNSIVVVDEYSHYYEITTLFMNMSR